LILFRSPINPSVIGFWMFQKGPQAEAGTLPCQRLDAVAKGFYPLNDTKLGWIPINRKTTPLCA
jgi:hypothetical protein